MRKIIGTSAATLAIAVVLSSSAAPASAFPSTPDAPVFGSAVSIQKPRTSATPASASGGWMFDLLPYIEQENLYRLSGGVNSSMGDGSVRFIAQGIAPQTWRDAYNPSGGEVLGTDYATVNSIMAEFVPWAQAHDKFVALSSPEGE